MTLVIKLHSTVTFVKDTFFRENTLREVLVDNKQIKIFVPDLKMKKQMFRTEEKAVNTSLSAWIDE